MSYKIAIVSADEKRIDETFGLAKRFLIYEISDGNYKKTEERTVEQESFDKQVNLQGGCNSDRCGTGEGCGDSAAASAKVELISDCRCIVCKKIGFSIQKQLERKAISSFDVDCSVEEALKKTAFYFSRIDNHQSLRHLKK